MDFRTVKWRKIGLLTLHTFASPNFALHNMRAYYVYYKCGDVSMEMLKIWYEWMEPRFRVLNSERQPFCTTYIGEDWANQIAHCHIYFSLFAVYRQDETYRRRYFQLYYWTKQNDNCWCEYAIFQRISQTIVIDMLLLVWFIAASLHWCQIHFFDALIFHFLSSQILHCLVFFVGGCCRFSYLTFVRMHTTE